MIPASRGWHVRYANGKQKALVAWDAKGGPLVVDQDSGHLVPADRFGEVEAALEPDPTIAIAPPGGWLVTCVLDASGRTDPLVGWGLKAWGEVVPLMTNEDGYVVEVDVANADTGHQHHVHHPDSTTQSSDSSP